jgi:hypothetical protein
MDSGKQRAFSRSVLRAHVHELDSSRLFETVRAGASDALAALLDDPRHAPDWLDGATFDELNACVYRLVGRDGLRKLLAGTMQWGLARAIEPIIHFVFKFIGKTPATLFSRTDSLLAISVRGVRMRWAASSASSGTIHVACKEPVPPVSWVAWEGIFGYIITLAGATGTVDDARPGDDGKSCEIDVHWDRN